MKKFTYIKALFSPFKPFKLRWYAGKVAIGTPYFFPRKWVKLTQKDVEKKAKESLENPNLIKKTYEEWCETHMNCTKAISKKIGFDFISLGWKTKWDSYRFEWTPLFSFVFFKWQIAVIIEAPHQSHYWEPWLYYELETDVTKSKKERIEDCRENAPQTWTSHKLGEEVTIDYYELILKKEYLK